MDAEKKFIANHFMMEGHSKSTLYDRIKWKENNNQAERKFGSGRLAKKMNQKVAKRLTCRFDHKDGISQRNLAKSFKVYYYVNYYGWWVEFWVE